MDKMNPINLNNPETGLTAGEAYAEKLGDEKGHDFIVTGVTATTFTMQSTISFYTPRTVRDVRSWFRPFRHGKKPCTRLRDWKPRQSYKRMLENLPDTPCEYTVLTR